MGLLCILHISHRWISQLAETVRFTIAGEESPEQYAPSFKMLNVTSPVPFVIVNPASTDCLPSSSQDRLPHPCIPMRDSSPVLAPMLPAQQAEPTIVIEKLCFQVMRKYPAVATRATISSPIAILPSSMQSRRYQWHLGNRRDSPVWPDNRSSCRTSRLCQICQHG